jgi:hypothetical protein
MLFCISSSRAARTARLVAPGPGHFELEHREQQAGEVPVAVVELARVVVEGGERAVERGGGVRVDRAGLAVDEDWVVRGVAEGQQAVGVDQHLGADVGEDADAGACLFDQVGEELLEGGAGGLVVDVEGGVEGERDVELAAEGRRRRWFAGGPGQALGVALGGDAGGRRWPAGGDDDRGGAGPGGGLGRGRGRGHGGRVAAGEQQGEQRGEATDHEDTFTRGARAWPVGAAGCYGPEMSDSRLAALISRLPKAELHVHLEGSIPPELAVRLAVRHGRTLPGMASGADGLRGHYRFADFGEFVRMYLAISACLVDARDFCDIAVALAGSWRRSGWSTRR